LGEKQTQQHRQHFNLSESAKQMLEELTAKRYPGKQRRQSQLVVDLITEAFTKEHREHSMNTVTTGMHDPEPDGLEPATTEAISMAHNEASRMEAIEVYPEHLLLGVIGQGESVDPWTTVEQRYMPGQVVTGVITRIVPFGAFARIEDGVEGLIPLSELRPGMDPEQNLREGQLVQLRILHIDAERRRLGLSLRQVDEVDLKETLVEGITICSSCKREVQSKWKHCVYCGASLARACPQCGSPQPEIEGARFCFECGGELE
jgi:predicted RNA-binding protein with RPS1 domain